MPGSEQDFETLTRFTEELVTEDEIREIVEKDTPSAYIGYAPTGTMHIGHYTTVRKIADFLEAGFHFKFLLADIHAELDIEKTPRELVEARTKYYRIVIQKMLEQAGVDPTQVEFVKGSEFQHDPEYQKGYMQIMEETTVNRMKRTVNEVVRSGDSMKASGLLYSAMQIMDTASPGLNVDIAYGGTDQRRIYMLGREVLPSMGEDKPACVFAPLLSGLSGGKMSASDESSKISVHDSEQEIREKIMDAYCPQGEAEDNGVLEYAKYLIFPVLEKRGETFTVQRPSKYGGDIKYEDYDELEEDFVNEDLHPQDLKDAVGGYLEHYIVGPVRDEIAQHQDLLEKAYPDKDWE